MKKDVFLANVKNGSEIKISLMTLYLTFILVKGLGHLSRCLHGVLSALLQVF